MIPIITALFAVSGVIFMTTSTFGTIPEGEGLKKIEQSRQYNRDAQSFEMPGSIPDPAAQTDMGLKSIWDFFFKKGNRFPAQPLPVIVPDMDDFVSPSTTAKIIWFGHSSLLVRMSGKNILIDPVFSSNASPVPFTVKRFQKPPLPLSGLPPIDIILISHDHYDHLDMKTIQFFKSKSTRFVVPLGVGTHLKKWGISDERITELDWWEKTVENKIECIAAPAKHFSGRGLFDRNKTLWASWIIRDGNQTLYYSGDSGYGPHFEAIGEKYGPFDLAFIECGQYNKNWRHVHMMPEESAKAYFDLKAKGLFPIHWGAFVLSMHTWHDPADRISIQAETRSINLVTPRLGEIFFLDGMWTTGTWWKKNPAPALINTGEIIEQPRADLAYPQPGSAHNEN